MTNDKNSYFNRAHRLGRIGTIIAILFMIGIPVVVCFIYDAVSYTHLTLPTKA